MTREGTEEADEEEGDKESNRHTPHPERRHRGGRRREKRTEEADEQSNTHIQHKERRSRKESLGERDTHAPPARQPAHGPLRHGRSEAQPVNDFTHFALGGFGARGGELLGHSIQLRAKTARLAPIRILFAVLQRLQAVGLRNYDIATIEDCLQNPLRTLPLRQSTAYRVQSLGRGTGRAAGAQHSGVWRGGGSWEEGCRISPSR